MRKGQLQNNSRSEELLSHKYASYLVCEDHIQEVGNFLSQFFEQIDTEYNDETWKSFKVPDTSFLVNLMTGEDQQLTQNMVFEIYCDSIEELEKYAEEYNEEIESFMSSQTKDGYKYNFVEIVGPEKICKVEVSFIEE